MRDYRRYIKRLGEYLKKHPVTLLAYCLMPNHVHLILRQDSDEPVDRFIHRLHTAYTMYFNKKYEKIGAVFQGRFKAKLIDTEEYLLHVSRYIHINPVELIHAQGPALSVELAAYPWSSYGEYLEPRGKHLCDSTLVLSYFSKLPIHGRMTYRSFIDEYLGVASTERLEEISSGDI